MSMDRPDPATANKQSSPEQQQQAEIVKLATETTALLTGNGCGQRIAEALAGDPKVEWMGFATATELGRLGRSAGLLGS